VPRRQLFRPQLLPPAPLGAVQRAASDERGRDARAVWHARGPRATAARRRPEAHRGLSDPPLRPQPARLLHVGGGARGTSHARTPARFPPVRPLLRQNRDRRERQAASAAWRSTFPHRKSSVSPPFPRKGSGDPFDPYGMAISTVSVD